MTTNSTSDLPIVDVLTVHQEARTRLVIIECPFCGSSHMHGWPYGDDQIGPRSADCTPGGNYTIPTPKES